MRFALQSGLYRARLFSSLRPGQLTFSSGRSQSPVLTQARYAFVVTSVLSRQKVLMVTSCGGFANAFSSRSRAPMNIFPAGMCTMPSGQVPARAAAEGDAEAVAEGWTGCATAEALGAD